MYDAPFYKGSQKLSKQRRDRYRGDSGIGSAVACWHAKARTSATSDTDPNTRSPREAEPRGQDCIVLQGDVTTAVSANGPLPKR